MANDFLKAPHAQTEYSPILIQELKKCSEDPVYFMRNYVFVQHPKRGKVPFDLYDYQVEMVNCIHNNRHSIVLASRQVGKTITIAIYLLWFAMFNRDKTVLVASNKFSNALEIMQRVQFAYEELPFWLKPGVSEFNKTSMEFDNGSRFFSQATTGDTGRGKALSKMFIDELAFVRKSIQDELWASIAPTLSTGGDMIISSTPNGDNELFATLWRGAKLGAGDSNGFDFVEVNWDRHPERDESFRQGMIAKIGQLKWNQEFENQFISSDPLLINSMKLQQLKPSPPTFEERGVRFWGEIDPRNSYYVGVDISVGISGDYSTIQVLEFPSMNQFAEFRSNTISPQQLYARVKWVLTYLKTPKEGTGVNGKTPEVYWSFENNGVGASLVALYQNEDKFPDAILLSDNDRTGVVTSAKSKLLSCLELKRLIEKTVMGMHINSYLLLEELKSYISNGKTTYHAKPGATDDLIAAMLIVMNVLKKATEYDEGVFEMMYSTDDDEEHDPSDPYGDEAPPMVF
jgi:hypothetical protein